MQFRQARTCFALASGLVLSSTAFAAPSSPVLNKVQAAYAALHSYQQTETLSIVPTNKKMHAPAPMVFTMQYQTPGQLYVNMGAQGGVIAADGTTLTLFDNMANAFASSPDPHKLSNISLPPRLISSPATVTIFSLGMMGLKSAQTMSQKILENASAGKDEMWGGMLCHTLQLAQNPYGLPETIYINPSTNLIAGAVWKSPSATIQETLSHVKVNSALPAAMFTYTPPANAVKVPASVFQHSDAILAYRFVGKPAPDFTLPDASGKMVSLSSLKGHVVVVDFWATWCGPCQMVMPTIEKIHAKLASKGVKVLGVDTWDQKTVCLAFLKSHPQYTMHVLLDPAERNAEKSVATSLYGVNGIPTTLVIDKAGNISAYILGAHKPEFYIDALKKAGVDTSGI